MKSILVILVFIGVVDGKELEMMYLMNNNSVQLPSVNSSVDSNYSKEVVRVNHINTSEKGFCSVGQAAEKLLKLSNANYPGFSDWGLIEDYKERVKKDCGPVKYYPEQIGKPGGKLILCYKLKGVCETNPFNTYDKEYCAFENEVAKLNNIYMKLLKKKDEKVEKHIKEIRNIAFDMAKDIIDDKVTKKLAENPFEQVRLSWKDMYDMRASLAALLAQRYKIYNVNLILNSLGKVIFSNFEYFSPMIALSGPAGFVVISGLPIVEETFQCNISVKNMLLKGGIAAGRKIILKVPVIKSNNISGVFADRFIKNATIEEVSKWVKHFFGDGLQVENVNFVKAYGKQFAIVTIKSAVGTAQHYSK